MPHSPSPIGDSPADRPGRRAGEQDALAPPAAPLDGDRAPRGAGGSRDAPPGPSALFPSGSVPQIVGVHLHLERDGKVLLGLRHPDSAYAGGLWHFLAGHCETESATACLVREAYEEAGLVVDPAGPTPRRDGRGDRARSGRRRRPFAPRSSRPTLYASTRM
ncbi:NUDIX domain-containing protein [Streptomyces cinereoruber]|uniref:NUDIX domain-containing protein n=1 Tax=Streptomyces cinereoruber TaxID=67260 RepID=UPI003C2E0FBF